MPELKEGQLLFSFPEQSLPVRFDDAAHGLSHCMSAVDIIVEFRDFHLFVEVKDPDQAQAKPKDRARFANELAQPKFARALSQKFRDSFLYRWAEERLDKPVRYVVLLQLSTLGPGEYMAVRSALARQLPLAGTPTTWSRQPCDGMAVLDMNTWNALGTYGSVRRA